MKLFRAFRLILLITIALLYMHGCSSPTGSPHENMIEVEGISAELGSETVFIPESVIGSALIETDTDQGQFTFSEAVLNDGDFKLEPGSILLISGVALGRITSVRSEGGQVHVETGFASLNEAFKEADIEWDRTFDFTIDMLENSTMEFQGKLLSPHSIVDGRAEWTISSGPYTGKASIEPKGSTATIVVVLKKEEGNTSVGFRAETTIKKIGNYTNIQIQDHKTRKFEFMNPSMGGEVELILAAAGGGLDQDIGIGPLTMFQLPFTVGPIPVVLSVRVRTVARVEVYGNSSAVANTKFSYDGRAGISYNGTEVSTNAADGIINPTHGGGSGDLAAMIGLNVDAQWGFAAPEIEFQMFGNTVVPYLRPEFYIGANLSWGPICQNISARYKVSSGLDVRFLGIASTNIISHDVVPEKRWDGFSPAGCNSQGKTADSLPDFKFIDFY